jgi:hypothetical protein
LATITAPINPTSANAPNIIEIPAPAASAPFSGERS